MCAEKVLRNSDPPPPEVTPAAETKATKMQDKGIHVNKEVREVHDSLHLHQQYMDETPAHSSWQGTCYSCLD